MHETTPNSTTEYGYVLSTDARLAVYESYKNVSVMIRGPEFDTDLSFWIVDGCEELMQLESGIPMKDFPAWLLENKNDQPAMEFNLL